MIVYRITNKINGKRYIGQTVQTMGSRWSKHCSVSNGNKGMPVVQAIQKYGADNFLVEVLVECSSIEEMNHREEYYIKLFKSQTPNGYNVLSGGLNSRHTEETKRKIGEGNKGKHVGKKVSLETREKLSKSHKGLKRSKEIREACSERVRGKKHPMYGKHHTDDAKNKIRKASLGRVPVNKGKQSSEETKKKISLAGMGKKPSEETVEKLRSVHATSDTEVLCHQNGIKYRTTADAARSLGLRRDRVKDVLKSRAKHVKGFTFEYVNKPTSKRKFKEKISILCHQNGKIYSSILQARKTLGVPPTGVYKSLRTGSKTKGYSFEYVKEDKAS